jgi:hypothetical protein
MNFTDQQEKVLDAIHFLTDPKFRDILKKGGECVNWEKVIQDILDAFPKAKMSSEFQPPAAPSPSIVLTTIREDINALKEIVSGSLESGIFGKIVRVLDRLEQRPVYISASRDVTPAIPYVPYVPPTIGPIGPTVPTQPWPPYTPYVGDGPNFNGNKLVCLGGTVNSHPDIGTAQNSGVSSPDATGHSGASDSDDIPF